MLTKYKVKNFKSFKKEAIIDLNSKNYKILSETNVQNDILKGILFVGANASGKSNAVLALKFLLDFLFAKSNVNSGLYYCFFSKDNTISLEYHFLIDNTNIKYNIFYQKKDKILIEELYLNDERVLNRIGSTAETTITEKPNYDNVPQNTLFLRDIYFNTNFRGNLVLQKWFDFLSNSIYFDLLSRNGILYKDINISLIDYLNDHGVNKINNFFDDYDFNQNIEYTKRSEGELVAIESVNENMVYFKKKGINEPIPLPLESLGNRILMELLPAFFHVIKNGGILILDEFSSVFHNDLEKLLIKYFMKNAKNAQLILVSHSTNLLTNSLLRPDQLYSVDFNQDGSVVKRFSSEQPREAQNLEKMYLGGVFNGVPNYADEA